MHQVEIHYFPLALPFLLALGALLLVLLALMLLRVLHYAYTRMGVAPQYVFAVMALSLVGSYVNIPVLQLPAERVVEGQEVVFFGMRYVIPVVHTWPGTIIAVNLGGAVVPALASLYLLAKNGLWLRGIVATALVTIVCHALARPVVGVGIAIPLFVPPLAAAVVALVLSRRFAAPLAYVGGSLGTLIGADVLNLGYVRGLGAPVASIGGAGTFDGIFLIGLLAVLLASLAIPGRPTQRAMRS